MKSKLDALVTLLKVLGDETRLNILNLLRSGEKNSIIIQETLNKSQSTVSQQLKNLLNEKLITVHNKGSKKYYKIHNPNIFDILNQLDQFIYNLNKEKIETLSTSDIMDILL